jgi:hypothetical protein
MPASGPRFRYKEPRARDPKVVEVARGQIREGSASASRKHRRSSEDEKEGEMPVLKAIIGTTIGVLLASFTVGCAGDGPDPGTGPGGEFAAIQNEIFTPSCISSSCHSSGTQAGGLSLAASESYDALVGVAPVNPTAAERGLLLVAPGDVSASFLVNKVNGNLGDGEGLVMPLGAPLLTPDQIAMIEIWIENGALPPTSD